MSEGKKVRWTIASARQNLPALVDLAAREPQDIYRRDELVARVVSPDDKIIPAKRKPSAAELLTQIQRACSQEDFSFEVSPRLDRPNPFAPKSKARRR